MAPAKLLLFGEHTVLHGGEALALPLHAFGARWSDGPTRDSDGPFRRWAAFAKTRPALRDALDLARWEAEADGLALASDIPPDYGLGSSGALTALTFRRYARDPRWSTLADASAEQPPRDTRSDELLELRALLGELEGYFHGRSSGLDPLVCLLQTAIHVDAGGDARQVDARLPSLSPGGGWFLLDSGQPKAGGSAIARFGVSCQSPAFRQNFLDPASALVRRLIADTLARDSLEPTRPRGLELLAQLSQLQRAHLGWLIPGAVAKTWSAWLADDRAYLKLCGAGGGGFFLGYTRDLGGLQADDTCDFALLSLGSGSASAD